MRVYKDAEALSECEEEDTYTYPQGHNLDEFVSEEIHLHVYHH